VSTFRTAAGGRIDRGATLEFTFDGQSFTGHPGDTLASALLAAGRHQIATSVKLGRPRGVTAAWAEDSGGLVQIEEPFSEPMLLAATVGLYDGLVAYGLPGQGRLADVPDSANYDQAGMCRNRQMAQARRAGWRGVGEEPASYVP
jgi:sarcosine oxidase, subunit alpha